MPKDGVMVLTGGAGFIGSCFLWKLNQAGEKNILLIDHNDSPVKMNNLKGKAFTDFIEKEQFIKNVKNGKMPSAVKVIFHIGACSSTTEADINYLQKNNTDYSKILCQWALTNQVPFYYASSAAAYGDGSQGYSDEDSAALKLSPLNPYGRSKHLFDLWLIENKLTNQVAGFRYFNVFGPNEYHKGDMRSVVVKAYEQIRKDGKVRLFKSYRPDYKEGEQKRDFIYVKDAVNLMYAFYRNGKIKGIYNIGTGRARTWNDLAKAIFSALGMEPRIEYIEMPEAMRDKYQYFTEADLNKLKKSGMSYAFTPLENAVADYIKNYLEKNFACL